MRRIALIAVVIGTIAVPARLSFVAGQARPTAACASCQQFVDLIYAAELRLVGLRAELDQTSAQLALLKRALADVQALMAQYLLKPATKTAEAIQYLTIQTAAAQAAVDAQAARLKEIGTEIMRVGAEIATWHVELAECNRQCGKPAPGDFPYVTKEPCPPCERLSADLAKLEANRAAVLRSLDALDASLGLSAVGVGRPVTDIRGGVRASLADTVERLDRQIASKKDAIEKCRLTCQGSKRLFITRPGVVLPFTGVVIGGVLVKVAGGNEGTPAGGAAAPSTTTTGTAPAPTPTPTPAPTPTPTPTPVGLNPTGRHNIPNCVCAIDPENFNAILLFCTRVSQLTITASPSAGTIVIAGPAPLGSISGTYNTTTGAFDIISTVIVNGAAVQVRFQGTFTPPAGNITNGSLTFNQTVYRFTTVNVGQ